MKKKNKLEKIEYQKLQFGQYPGMNTKYNAFKGGCLISPRKISHISYNHMITSNLNIGHLGFTVDSFG